MTTQIKVEGMTCNHCKMTVENGIKGIEGVEGATANIHDGTVTIDGSNVDLLKVEEAVNGLGYTFVRKE